MEFIDEVNMELHAGAGGDGVVAFIHEKYMDMGGPGGGNGGSGGSIIFKGCKSKSTLMDLKYHAIVKAKAGEHGGNKNCTGKSADDITILVPLGTLVTERQSGRVIADIVYDGQEVIVAHGGKGGRGNATFATSRRTTPEICEKGTPGEDIQIHVELKVLADCGLVGYPSVGKSTLISVVSAAKPRIADYPFTTLTPQLGVVYIPDGRSFVMADLPGLIEGASEGVGLGHEFLRHIERTKVLVHLIDMSSESQRDPYEDYVSINHELEKYDAKLMNKPMIVVANKMDMPGASERLEAFKAQTHVNVIPISAYAKMNTNTLMYTIADAIDEEKKKAPEIEVTNEEVEYTFKPKEKPFTIKKCDDGIYQVTGPMVETYVNLCDFKTEDNIRIFSKRIRDLGVDDELRKLGVKTGDTVRILDYEFEFFE